jgi:hypothetical protein
MCLIVAENLIYVYIRHTGIQWSNCPFSLGFKTKIKSEQFLWVCFFSTFVIQ